MQSQILLKNFLKIHQGQVEFLGLRSIYEKSNTTSVRNEILESADLRTNEGVMVEVMLDGHFGYSATSDVSEVGLKNAYHLAFEQTKKAALYKVFSFPKSVRPSHEGSYLSPRKKSLNDLKASDVIEVLMKACVGLKTSERVVTRKASTIFSAKKSFYITSEGTEIDQDSNLVMVEATATAQKDTEFQSRTLNGWGSRTYQMGAEALFENTLFHDCQRVGEDAVELVFADNCPAGVMDLMIAPDQMMLQIHESIGHPLEMDRILGDERNFAGWSFIKMADIGSLQYGSSIMNVTFDPTVQGEAASFAFDDGGSPAHRVFLIKDGILKCGLGAAESQVRSGKPGVANFRAACWNRAPIDRMANINLEAGTDQLKDMIASVDRGILVRSNKSWSIDDYRNKFQFGCEYGQLIENGKLTKTVKNSNYRGTTLDFWRSLKKISDKAETFASLYCGKGEPSQVIHVGHTSPYCLFNKVEVFGG